MSKDDNDTLSNPLSRRSQGDLKLLSNWVKNVSGKSNSQAKSQTLAGNQWTQRLMLAAKKGDQLFNSGKKTLV